MTRCFILIVCLIVTNPVIVQDTRDEKLAVFSPFIGTWKAEFTDGTNDFSN